MGEEFQPDDAVESIDSGNYLPHMLLTRLPAEYKMIVTVVGIGMASALGGADTPFVDVAPFINLQYGGGQGNIFWWAEPSSGGGSIVHLEILGDIPADMAGWGAPLRAIGVNVNNKPKVIKRMKEIVRFSGYHTTKAPRIHVYKHLGDEKEVDGMNVITRRYARKMGVPEWVKRVNLRDTRAKLAKGDAMIIPTKQMQLVWGDYDMVFPDVNLKDELSTSGWGITTASRHHPHNQALWDMQSASWLGEWLYPGELMDETLTTIISEALGALERGEWPKWMILSEGEAHLDDSTAPKVLEKADTSFYKHYLRWQMSGLDVQASAAIMGMAANAFEMKLQSRLNFKTASGKAAPKYWFPLPWAFYGHVITDVALEDLGGFTIPDEYVGKVWYHKTTHSIVVPAQAFIDNFENHGTWDLDDSVRVIVRKDVHSGRVVCVLVRSPNSDGEYSVHDVVLDTLPLYHTYGEIPPIDLSAAPAQLAEVQAKQKVRGLTPDSWVRDAEFTEREAQHSLHMQIKNPGVGNLANAMMVFYTVFGRSPKTAPASMGDMVDVLQQTPSIDAFKEITAFADGLWESILASGKPVDLTMKNIKVPAKYKVVAANPDDSYFYQRGIHFGKEVARFAKEQRAIAFRHRSAHAVRAVMDMQFTPEEFAAAANWMRAYEKEFDRINAEATERYKGDHVLRSRTITKGNQELVRKARNKLLAKEVSERDTRIFAMYQWAVLPGTIAFEQHGKKDRILFAPAGRGEITVMDLFIEALIRIGAAHPAPILDLIPGEDILLWMENPEAEES